MRRDHVASTLIRHHFDVVCLLGYFFFLTFPWQFFCCLYSLFVCRWFLCDVCFVIVLFFISSSIVASGICGMIWACTFTLSFLLVCAYYMCRTMQKRVFWHIRAADQGLHRPLIESFGYCRTYRSVAKFLIRLYSSAGRAESLPFAFAQKTPLLMSPLIFQCLCLHDQAHSWLKSTFRQPKQKTWKLTALKEFVIIA